MRKGSVVTSVVSSAMLIISATFFVSYEAEARPTSEMLSTTMVAACSVTCYACGPLVSHGTQADPGGLHLGNWHQDCIGGYCADTHPDRVLGANVTVLYRHLPGLRHKFAIPAIRASECAAEHGRFQPMHDALFSYQDSLGTASWWWFAKTAGLQDSLAFDACMRRQGPIPALERDTIAARRLGATGTPTLLIHEIRLNGVPSFDSLRVYVDRARSKAER